MAPKKGIFTDGDESGTIGNQLFNSGKKMARFIRLTAIESGSLGSEENKEITVNTMKILWIEDTHERELGNSRVLLENGKSLFVEEDQDEIRDLANGE